MTNETEIDNNCLNNDKNCTQNIEPLDGCDKNEKQLNSTRLSTSAELIDYDFKKLGKKFNSKKNKTLNVSNINEITLGNKSESEVETDVEKDTQEKTLRLNDSSNENANNSLRRSLRKSGNLTSPNIVPSSKKTKSKIAISKRTSSNSEDKEQVDQSKILDDTSNESSVNSPYKLKELRITLNKLNDTTADETTGNPQEKSIIKTRSKSLVNNSDEEVKSPKDTNKKGKKRSMTVSSHTSDVESSSKRVSRSESKKILGDEPPNKVSRVGSGGKRTKTPPPATRSSSTRSSKATIDDFTKRISRSSRPSTRSSSSK